MFYNFKHLDGELLINTNYIASLTCEDGTIIIVSKLTNKDNNTVTYHLRYKNQKQAIKAHEDFKKALNEHKTTFMHPFSNVNLNSTVDDIKKKLTKVSKHIVEDLTKEPTGFIFTIDFNNIIVKIPRGTVKDVELIEGQYYVIHNNRPLMKALGNNYGHLLYYKEDK